MLNEKRWSRWPTCGHCRRMFGSGSYSRHLGFLGEVHLGRGLGYLDDDELIAILYRHKAELEARSLDGEGLGPARADAPISVSGSPMLVDAAPAADVSR